MAEKELSSSRGPKAEWEKDRVWIRFMNFERKGEAHTFTVNGKFFHLKHGEVRQVPVAVVHALEDAIKIEWKVEDVDINGVTGKKAVSYEDPRFGVQVLSEEQAKMLMPDSQKKESSVISDIIGKQTSEQAVAQA